MNFQAISRSLARAGVLACWHTAAMIPSTTWADDAWSQSQIGATSARQQPADYDLVIRNAKIVDGTGNPWFHGDVAVRGERIVAVGVVPPAAAKRTIDAQDMCGAGFIDIHSPGLAAGGWQR